MKVGIAGAGFMGKTHANCYAGIADTELYALAEQNPDKQRIFNNIFPNTKIYDDVFEMINDIELDIIDICLPTPLHAPVAIAALNKNKNVLLEKPIALNPVDALSIKKAADTNKGKFMVAQVLRFWPEYTMIRKIFKEYMHDDSIKEIYSSRFNEIPLWSENTWIMSEEQSGGIIIDLMIHDIDFIIWNFGKVEQVFGNAIYNDKNFAIQVMAILKMENGTTAYVEGGYLNPVGSGLSSQMKIYGNNSLLEMNSHENAIKLTQDKNSIKEFYTKGKDGYYEEINYFINCIKQNKNPEVIKVEDAIESLITCQAIRKSLKEEKWINIS
jgi:predicted dehydrogenase